MGPDHRSASPRYSVNTILRRRCRAGQLAPHPPSRIVAVLSIRGHDGAQLDGDFHQSLGDQQLCGVTLDLGETYSEHRTIWTEPPFIDSTTRMVSKRQAAAILGRFWRPCTCCLLVGRSRNTLHAQIHFLRPALGQARQFHDTAATVALFHRVATAGRHPPGRRQAQRGVPARCRKAIFGPMVVTASPNAASTGTGRPGAQASTRDGRAHVIVQPRLAFVQAVFHALLHVGRAAVADRQDARRIVT